MPSSNTDISLLVTLPIPLRAVTVMYDINFSTTPGDGVRSSEKQSWDTRSMKKLLQRRLNAFTFRIFKLKETVKYKYVKIMKKCIQGKN